MGKYRKVIDGVSIASGGGNETGDSVTVDSRDTIALQITGDTNSTNLDVELQGKNGGQVTTTYGDVDTTSYTGQDLTTGTNTSKIYLFDVSGLAEIRPNLVNNNTSNTTVTATIGVDDNN